MMTAHSLSRLVLCLALAFAQWLAAAGTAWAQPAPIAESAVKAAFLYKFAGFVEWPPGTFTRPEQPLVIAVSGDDEVGSDLEQLVAGRTLEGRPVSVRKLPEMGPAPVPHVLFLGSRREARLRDAIEAAPGPVLVVTEQAGALRMGSVINFSTEAERLRFSVSLTSAEARKLKLSARLLAMAQVVVEGRNR
jgi:hypothetical protein